MLTVGLTGGVASGKSAVAALLARQGVAVRDADALVAELYEPGQACTQAIASRFGADILTAEGRVDRTALGARVLGDDRQRRWLEAVVHPAVRAAVSAWIGALGLAPGAPRVAVVEAALLVETGSWTDYDRLVVVSTPLELRRQRAREAGWAPETFELVLAAQLDDSAREAVADYVVVNHGGRDDLAVAVGRLWSWLEEDAIASGSGQRLQSRRPAVRLG